MQEYKPFALIDQYDPVEGTTAYFNTAKTAQTQKNDCSSGIAGSLITLTAEANKFVSDISVIDADEQAEAWLSANKQAYANNLGTCGLTRLDPPIISSQLLDDGMSINVFWSMPPNNTGVTGYQLYRKVGSSTEWILFRTIRYGDITSFLDNLLNPQTTYSYKIRATDAAENWSDFSNETYQAT